MPVKIDVNGATRVANKLRTMTRKTPGRTDAVIISHINFLRRVLKSTAYPPKMKKPPQKYRRTGKLANSWARRKVRAGRHMLVNTAPYSSYVVGTKEGAKGVRQAWMHRNSGGGAVGPYAGHRAKRLSKPWWNADEVAKEYNKRLTRNLTAAIMKDWQ